MSVPMPDRSVGLPTLLRRSVGPLGRIAVANRGGWLDVVGRIHAVLAVLGGHHDPVPIRAPARWTSCSNQRRKSARTAVSVAVVVFLLASHMVSLSYGQGLRPGRREGPG